MLDNYMISQCNSQSVCYPKGMKNLAGMPPILYYRGNIEIINSYKNVAIVGSRKTSYDGLKLSYEAGRLAARMGINVVNGLALGCDTEALKGALSVGGKCIAVMPAGLEQVYPKSNNKLADAVLENGGCLISQYPVGTGIRDYQYVERDRLQSAISQGVIIIEAQEKSGTMHTADFARQQLKRLACYHFLLVNSASGNKQLEERGKAKILKAENDLQAFLKDLALEEVFEQLTLTF